MADFELWETSSGNLMGSYASKGAALAIVADAIQAHGHPYINTIALVREDGRGRSRVVAEGVMLAAMAEAAQSSSRKTA